MHLGAALVSNQCLPGMLCVDYFLECLSVLAELILSEDTELSAGWEFPYLASYIFNNVPPQWVIWILFSLSRDRTVIEGAFIHLMKTLIGLHDVDKATPILSYLADALVSHCSSHGFLALSSPEICLEFMHMVAHSLEVLPSVAVMSTNLRSLASMIMGQLGSSFDLQVSFDLTVHTWSMEYEYHWFPVSGFSLPSVSNPHVPKTSDFFTREQFHFYPVHSLVSGSVWKARWSVWQHSAGLWNAFCSLLSVALFPWKIVPLWFYRKVSRRD